MRTYNPDALYAWAYEGEPEYGYLTHYLSTLSTPETQAVFKDEVSKRFRHENKIQDLREL